SGIVRNLAAEFLFEGHDQLDRVQAVGAEIVDKAGAFGNLLGFDAQVFHHDLLNPLANVTHRSNLMPFGWGSIGKAIRAVHGPRGDVGGKPVPSEMRAANCRPSGCPRPSQGCRLSYFIWLGQRGYPSHIIAIPPFT